MRKAYERPPLNDGNPPSVTSITGLGTGGGAGVAQSAGSGSGTIAIRSGTNPSASWSIVLTFAIAPPVLFFGMSNGAPLTVTNNGTQNITVASSTALKPNTNHILSYEWVTV